MTRMMRLGAILPGGGQHVAAWRHPDQPADGATSLAFHIHLANLGDTRELGERRTGTTASARRSVAEHLQRPRLVLCIVCKAMPPVLRLFEYAASFGRRDLLSQGGGPRVHSSGSRHQKARQPQCGGAPCRTHNVSKQKYSDTYTEVARATC